MTSPCVVANTEQSSNQSWALCLHPWLPCQTSPFKQMRGQQYFTQSELGHHTLCYSPRLPQQTRSTQWLFISPWLLICSDWSWSRSSRMMKADMWNKSTEPFITPKNKWLGFVMILLFVWRDYEGRGRGLWGRGLRSHSWHPRLKGDYELLSRALGHPHRLKCVEWFTSLKLKLIDHTFTNICAELSQLCSCWSRGPSQGVCAFVLQLSSDR